MKAYPAYKDSGIEWLGEIPVGWGLQRLKWLVRKKLQYGANEAPESEDGSLPRYIRITDFGEDGKLRDDTFKSLSYEKAKDYLLTEGDILFARSGATVGKTFQFTNYKGSACFAGYLIKAAPDEKKIISDFLYAFTKSNSYENWKKGTFIQATIQNIGADKYNSLPVPLPPLPEQRAIAAFLDHKTRLIDTYVAKKQQQIERLLAYRTALINQAVTKGLNPDASMKDSGIEWLGEIPAHWEVKKLKYVTQILRGRFSHRPRNDERLYDGKFPFIQTGDVSNANKYINTYQQTLNDLGYSVSKEFPKGTLVMTIAANIGDLAILNFDACFPDSIVGFKPNKDVAADYLYYSLKSMREEFLRTSVINTQLNLNIDRISNLPTGIPPLHEQRAIIDFIESKTNQIDRNISKTQHQIERLQAYRTSLISEAVTGKIDVRTDNYRDYT